jgi:hypothetical protein
MRRMGIEEHLVPQGVLERLAADLGEQWVREHVAPEFWPYRDVRVRSGGAFPAGRTEESYPYRAAADVRALIEHGLRIGWVPATRGGAFQITSGADVTLPGLVLTDLLWTAQCR